MTARATPLWKNTGKIQGHHTNFPKTIGMVSLYLPGMTNPQLQMRLDTLSTSFEKLSDEINSVLEAQQ
jgi:hypothetical protein